MGVVVAGGLLFLAVLAFYVAHRRAIHRALERKDREVTERIFAVKYWRRDESQPGMVMVPWTPPTYEDEEE